MKVFFVKLFHLNSFACFIKTTGQVVSKTFHNSANNTLELFY